MRYKRPVGDRGTVSQPVSRALGGREWVWLAENGTEIERKILGHPRGSVSGMKLSEAELRDAIADQLESELRPLVHTDEFHGGYDCCGCSTYDAILDHAIRIVSGQPSTAR